MNSVVSADGTPIAYERFGAGPALVLVGGALSDRSASVDVATALAPRMTVLIYDRRGRGNSGDGDAYDVAREIEDISALIAAAGGSALVYGHSSGAVLALRAVIAGEAIHRLGVYEPPFFVDWETRPPLPDDYVTTIQRLIDAGRPEEALDYFFRVGLLLPDELVAAQRDDRDWPRAVELAHTLPYDMAVVGDQMWGRPLPAEWRDKITIPTLVLDGDQSPVFMRNPARQLAELLPNSEQRTLAGFAHGAPANVLVPILEEFFLR